VQSLGNRSWRSGELCEPVSGGQVP
jgi:hypothetical protein